MKFLLTIILFASFIGIAVFGLFGMRDMQNHNGNCAFKASQGIDCPKQVSPIDYFVSHLDVFKSFLVVIFSDGFFTSFLLFVLFIVGASMGMPGNNLIFPQLNFAYSRHRLDFSNPLFNHKLIRWLALHENSPS
ncbi:MAG: hypothetical protein AAB396_02915 [Patescibacteria group bacterium]